MRNRISKYNIKRLINHSLLPLLCIMMVLSCNKTEEVHHYQLEGVQYTTQPPFTSNWVADDTWYLLGDQDTVQLVENHLHRVDLEIKDDYVCVGLDKYGQIMVLGGHPLLGTYQINRGEETLYLEKKTCDNGYCETYSLRFEKI